MSVVVMSLPQHISHCDRALLSEVIGKASTPTWFVRLVFGLLGPVSILKRGASFPDSVCEVGAGDLLDS